MPKLGANTGNAGKGRPKGSVNKTTKAVRELVVDALHDVGGKDWLIQLAKDDPKTFSGLIGRVIPLQVDANVKSTVTTKEQRDAAVAAFIRSNS
ncbi:hypothetical protein [Mesorhizobium sp. WSM4303]|uniref:hypothetical protein n=1 Tax=Mesorhizobium sp. WSM4303 TaxID=2589887 RepID=UPI00163DC901|nr:hypothetical protein [Mesorhizobium sp. WSM4303]